MTTAVLDSNQKRKAFSPYGKFTHDFTYEIFICEIVMWNWNNSYMKISYVKSISHMKVSHMKFSYVKSLCGIGTIHI